MNYKYNTPFSPCSSIINFKHVCFGELRNSRSGNFFYLANQSGKEKAKYTRLRYRYLQFRGLVCFMTWRFEIKDSRYALHLTSKGLGHGEFH